MWPHESQHTRPPCPSPAPGVHSNSCPSSRWCNPAILSSVIPFSSFPQSLPASVFSNESTLPMRLPKYWSFSFSIIPSKEHPGLISFRMDWLDLLAVQGTLRSLLQHHSSKASILWRSAFFTVQLSLELTVMKADILSVFLKYKRAGIYWSIFSPVYILNKYIFSINIYGREERRKEEQARWLIKATPVTRNTASAKH